MSAPAITVVSKPPPAQFVRLTGTEDPIDVSIERLRVQSTLKNAGLDVDVSNLITTGNITDSFTSAPQLVFSCLDRNYKALNSGVFDDTVEVDLDGVVYRLVEVSLTDTEILQLTWEHKIVNLLRQHKKFLSAVRGTVTRAQFIEILLREILVDFPDLIYVCPEINTVQKVTAAKKTGRSLTSKSLGSTGGAKDVKGAGFGVSSLDIRDWDGSMTTLGPSQLHNAATVLDVCAQLKANAKATLAVMEACLVEPDKPYENPPVEPGSGGSAGILQFGGGGTSLPAWANDVASAVTHALQDPGATGKGGMMSLSVKNPGWSAGQVAQAEQGSAIPGRYDQAQTGAQQVINAYTKAGGFAATGASGLASSSAAASQYDFTRGQSGQTEDSYTCALRLASEVQWRFFIAGRRTVYFCTDDDLLNAAVKYTISPGNQGIAKPTFDIEKGGRTVVVRRHRIAKPSEGQVDVRVKRWEAQVGDVIEHDGYGPADDKALLKQVDRDLFDKAGTLYWQSPQKALPEPAATSTTSSTAATIETGDPTLKSANPIDRVYAASAAMSARNLPYFAGGIPQGGHGGTWAQEIMAHGQDCSSSVSIVLYQAGLMNGFSSSIVSGGFNAWGQPGRGTQMTVWYNAGHVFIEFYGRPAKRFDTVPGGSGGNGPHLRMTAPGDSSDTWENSGFSARHWPGF